MSLELTIQRIERDNPAPGGSMEEVLGYLKDYLRITKALPKTADGFSIVPGMTVWHEWGGDEPSDILVYEVYTNGVWPEHYSSREAAERAAKAK